MQLLQHSDPSIIFRRRIESAEDEQAPGQQQQQKGPTLRMNALFLALVLENSAWASAVLDRGRTLQVIRKTAERLRQQEQRDIEREQAQREARGQQSRGAKGAKKGGAQQQGKGGRKAQQGPQDPVQEEITPRNVLLPWLQNQSLGVAGNQTVLLKCAPPAATWHVLHAVCTG